MKIIIAGSRNFTNYALLESRLDHLFSQLGCDVEIVSGCARGADTLAIQYAQSRGFKVHKFPADWDKHGKSAGIIRNKKMTDFVAPDGGLVAFWDGKSTGTKHMIDIAGVCGLNLKVIKVP